MARKSKPVKTKYQNIYEVEGENGGKDYLASWKQNSRRYHDKNLTRIFGATTAMQASKKLDEIKVLIARGEDPFEKEDEDNEYRTIKEIVLEEISNRDAGDTYKYTLKISFEKHLVPLIGNLYLEDMSIKKMTSIFAKLKKTVSDDTIENLKKAIRPSFDFAVDEGDILKNPLDAKRVKKVTRTSRKSKKAPLKHRLLGNDNTRFLNAAKAFYNGALHFEKNLERRYEYEIPDEEYQLVFLMAVMTGRRRSEILNIKYEDITTYNTIKTSIDTTKTGVWEEYPLPQEVIDLLDPDGKGKIAPSVTTSTYGKYMKKLIDGLDLAIHSDLKVTGHDTRHLFLTIMSKETKNPFLCDSALSHSDSKYDMLRTYYEPDIADYNELFNLYWDLLRGIRGLTI